MICGSGVQYAERITGVRCLQARRASRSRRRNQGRWWWVILCEDRFGTYRAGQAERGSVLGSCWTRGKGFEGRIHRSVALHVDKGPDVPMWGFSFRRLICTTEADV